MCGLGKDVEAGKILSRVEEALGCQELLDRKIGKLNDRLPIDVHNRDQTGTRGKHSFFWSLRAPICVVGGKRSIKLNREDLGKFLDTKRSIGYGKALKEAMGIIPFLHRDFQQNSLICLVQTPRQVIQSGPYRCRNTST
jgi:hypothetical protein